jgi:phosphotransferase system enzyme I (PtsI)
MADSGLSRSIVEFPGLSITSGKVMGPACLFSAEHHLSVEESGVADDAIALEIGRFDKALQACSKELESIAMNVATNVGMAEGEIFLTQKHIMNDGTIVQQIRKGIAQDKKNAESVIVKVFRAYENKFASMDDQYLRERATDIGEIRRRLLDNISETKPKFLCEGQEHCRRGSNRIIVAHELTADMMVHMNFEKVRGIVTEHGGISSHAAIIARSLGIPAISGARDIMNFVKCGDTILLDGDSGMVYIDPPQSLIARVIPPQSKAQSDLVCALESPEGMELCANASSIEDVKLARQFHADGIGLFRTEILFLKADRLLDEEEQFAYYSQVVAALPDKTITFRLLDVGGDKPLPFLRLKKETNPYLGWRGARFLLGSPDIFKAQIRPLVRLSKTTKIRILFPMVVDARQQGLLNGAVREIIVSESGASHNIELGAMFEVPSACMQAAEILKLVDFGSIGSNDLIQYLFAVDRNNEQVSVDYDPDHPVLWEMLASLVTAAKHAGKALSICGEMAGREGMPGKLLGIGLRSLSVSPRLVPQVRKEMVEYAEKR